MWDKIKTALGPIAERAAKTFAQALAAAVIATGATSLTGVDWGEALGIAALAAVMSALTSVASWKLGSQPGPSLASETTKKPKTTTTTELTEV